MTEKIEIVSAPKRQVFYIPRLCTRDDIAMTLQTITPESVGAMLMGSPPRACTTVTEAEQIIKGWIDEIKKHYAIAFLTPEKTLKSPITVWKDIRRNTVVWSSVNAIEVWDQPTDIGVKPNSEAPEKLQ